MNEPRHDKASRTLPVRRVDKHRLMYGAKNRCQMGLMILPFAFYEKRGNILASTTSLGANAGANTNLSTPFGRHDADKLAVDREFR